MPRFYFDIHDGIEFRDEHGTELANAEAARIHAMQVAADYAGRPHMLSARGGAVVVSIRKEGERRLATIRLVLSIEDE